MTDIIMPKMGDAMTEGKVLRWYKKAGEAVKKGEPALVLTRVRALQQVAINELAREPDPQPAAGPRVIVVARRYEIVEGPVQVGERDVHRDASDRQLFAGRLLAP